MKPHQYLEIPVEQVREEAKKWQTQYHERGIQRAEKVAIEQKILRDLISERGKCDKCPATSDLTLDHIIPVHILGLFGCDVTRFILEGNYGLLCRRCNLFKGSQLDFANPHTKGLMIKLIATVPDHETEKTTP